MIIAIYVKLSAVQSVINNNYLRLKSWIKSLNFLQFRTL